MVDELTSEQRSPSIAGSEARPPLAGLGAAGATQPGLMSMLHPPERRGLHEIVLDQLLDAIRMGTLRPGDRLLETEIAERLGMSRGMVREAIRRLEQEGLVVTNPHRGTFIAHLSTQETAELLTLRSLLEPFAAALAVRYADETTIDQLKAAVDSMVAASERGDRAERIRLDLGFHEQVIRSTGHTLLLRIWTTLALRLRLVHFDPSRQSWPGPILVHRAESHYDFVEHLRHRDSEAAVAWMRNHIESISRKIVGEIGGSPESSQLDEILAVSSCGRTLG